MKSKFVLTAITLGLLSVSSLYVFEPSELMGL